MAGARRSRRARGLICAGLALSVLTPSPAAATTSDQDLAAARRAASAAAVQVGALTQEYTRRSRSASLAVTRLEASFATSTRAASDAAEQHAGLRRAQARRDRTVRALYAGGGPAALIATVLLADSPDEALWRATTSRQVLQDVLDEQTAGVLARQRSAAQAAASQASLEAADTARAQALADAQREAALARSALARARATLARLGKRARRLQAAQEAERRLAAAVAAAGLAAAGSPSPAAMEVPAEYLAAYRAAAGRCSGLRWTLLAAIGQVESGHGRNDGPSSAGAIGPMQFMPATFARYAVDGDGDGLTDPWNPEDAIFTAARYLCATGIETGGPDGVRAALFAYNHAEWYVDLVLAVEQAIINSRT